MEPNTITPDGTLRLFLHGSILLFGFVADGEATVSLKFHPWPYLPLGDFEEKRRVLSVASAPLSECSIRRIDDSPHPSLWVSATGHLLPRIVHVDLAEAWLARMRGGLQ